MEGFEQRVRSYLRKWLGLPRCLGNIELYGNSNKPRLPFSSVRVEFIVAERHQSVRTWDCCEGREEETQLRHKAILGTVAQGTAGLGSLTTTRYDSTSGKERQRLEQVEVRASVEEEQTSRAVAIRKQGEEVGTGKGMECHLEGHLVMENQVRDTGAL